MRKHIAITLLGILIAFADETSAFSTYNAGRLIHVRTPVKSARTNAVNNVVQSGTFCSGNSHLCMGLQSPTEETKSSKSDEDESSGIHTESSNEIQIENKEEEEESNIKFGLWASRGLLLVVAALFGTNFASVKYLETLCFSPPCDHSASEAALARFGVAALASIPFLVGQSKDIIIAGFECGILITLGYITQSLALETIPSGKCAFICSLTVVLVPLVTALTTGRPVKPLNIFAAALAMSGVGILEGVVDFGPIFGVTPAIADATVASTVSGSINAAANALSTTSSASSLATTATSGGLLEGANSLLTSAAASLDIDKGDLLALGQPVGFGISFLRIEHYVDKFKDVESRVLTLSAAQCVSVGLFSLVWVLADYQGSIPNMTYMLEPHRLAAILWTGLVTTVLAIYLEGIALQTATATDASITFSSEPVWASLFGSWLLNEGLNTNSYVGGTVILAACLTGALADQEGHIPEDEEAIEVKAEE